MSQSDYLKYKRISTILDINEKRNTDLPVFESQQYLNYKQYSLENTILNTSKLYNRITPKNQINIFNMDKTVTDCPSFIVCRGTHLRPNRVAMSTVYYTPTILPKTINDNKIVLNTETGCKCEVYG